jgi:hypothetical protein
MKAIKIISLSILLVYLSLVAQGQNQSGQGNQASMAASRKQSKETVQVTPGAANSVSGSGTPGQIAKWTGVSGSNTYVLGNSTIFEDKFGKVGIGTTTPTSLFTVAGMIETTSGGVKFPDGTVQTTAASLANSPQPQPFAKVLSATFPAGGVDTSAMFTVPVGKRLTIETVSLLINLPLGQNLDSLTIATSVNGQLIYYSLFPVPIPQSGSSSFYGITQPFKIYADAGTQVSAQIHRPSGLGDGGFNLALSGYLVDAQ